MDEVIFLTEEKYYFHILVYTNETSIILNMPTNTTYSSDLTHILMSKSNCMLGYKLHDYTVLFLPPLKFVL